MKQFIGLALLTIIATSTSFSINVNSTCTQYTVGQPCLSWTQTGSITQNTAACFPGQVQVETSLGIKKMSELTIGDKIKSLNKKTGNIEYSPIRLWFHKDAKKIQNYLRLKSQNTEIFISQYHNIGNGKYFLFAKQMLQKSLTTSNLNDQQYVKNIQTVQKIGIYAPLTLNNNFYVYSNGKNILVHCFSNIRNPELYQMPFNAVLNIGEYFGLSNSNQQQAIRIHPIAQKAIKYFPFLTEGLQE